MPAVTLTKEERRHVHRELHLVSPRMHGPDVKQLQIQLNALADHYAYDWRLIATDSEYGRQTRHLAETMAWRIGLEDSRLNAIEHGRITEAVQHLLRNPRDRSQADRHREASRRSKAAAAIKAHHSGAVAVVKWAIEQDGTHEQPAGSNSGPKISDWEAFWGLGAVYWCGCFAGYAVRKIGGSSSGTWFPYAPSITNDARAARNGLHAVPFDEARPGDVLTYWNGEHVGLVRERPQGDSIATVEGNTSAADGSQSNGGQVALKTRSRSDVDCVARPTYA